MEDKTLKTLKDLNHNIDINPIKTSEDLIVTKELKSEAIKWVKNMELNNYDNVRLFLDFFNLTEEDLK